MPTGRDEVSGLMRRHRVSSALLLLLAVIAAGTVGYVLLGFGPLDALYQTVTTVTTVGFREVKPMSHAGMVFTIVLILAGVGTALYALSLALESFLDGHFRRQLEGRRMERTIARLRDHVIVCGYGRVGRAAAQHLKAIGHPVVIVDRDLARLEGLPYPYVLGDISNDDALLAAGIERAKALVATLETDADNVYVALSARALRPDLVIIARARSEDSTAKLYRAGANRVVNAQLIGGRRMAAYALTPDVAEFLDVVMHDETLDFRIEQVEIGEQSPVRDRRIDDVAIGERTGVVVLAARPPGSTVFVPAPPVHLELAVGTILIVVGTPAQLTELRTLVDGRTAGHGSLHR